ncbi:MAG: MMPL family transporter [Bacteroidia bacterium]
MNPIWKAIATFILRRRIYILVFLGSITLFMWTQRSTEMVQAMSEMVLTDDPAKDVYDRFKSIFGDDGNVLVASLDGDFSRLELFGGIETLTREIESQAGVNSVISITRLYDIVRDDSLESFRLVPLVQTLPTTQAEVDSVFGRMQALPFYRGLLLDDSLRTTLIAVSLDPKLLDTEYKIELVRSVKGPIERFAETHGMEAHFAGMPVIRVNFHESVKKELFMFLGLALIVTGITLLVFFRSLYTVIFPMIVVGSVIIFSLGLIGLFGYKISIITGIIPALITVISIPNSVYLITKYHIEYRRTRNKMKALIMVVEKIGIVTVMTNATTAIGMGVLAFTDIQPLREFGIVGSLCVVAAFFISLLLIPIVFSYLPPPNFNQTRHLDRRGLNFMIRTLNQIVQKYTWTVYVAAVILTGLSIWGMFLIRPVSYVVDDVPQDSKVLRDLKYVESRFNGAMPFEIMIDTGKKRGVIKLKTLQHIAALQDSLDTYDDISRSVSVADLAKFFRQAFFDGRPQEYDLPTRNEYNFIIDYARSAEMFGGLSLSKTLVDTNLQVTRISASVRDIGSLEMEKLVENIRTDLDSIFEADQYVTEITGGTQIFIKANKSLIDNLLKSLALAFVVIAFIMGLLFRSVRMVLISLIPNALPLIIVAGIMGFMGIALKPSTALVFGVAFGIAVDDSIHFLARYRLARRLGDSIRQAVTNSFLDTGVSMIYTSIILFFGFVSFAASDFGGTQALGVLTSMTLAIAMFSNLLFLPVLLITFDKEASRIRRIEVADADSDVSDTETHPSYGN